MNLESKNSKALIPVILVGVPCIIRIMIYLYVAIKGIGTFAFSNYISIVINFIMYISILKYAVDYFIKGKDVSLKSLIFKFGIASLATLFGLQTGNKTVFMLTAVMVFIVPYISALLNSDVNKKKAMLVSILAIVVLMISIVLTVLYIMNPVESEVTSMGTLVYNLDAMNSAVEWALFTILGFARGIVAKSWKNEASGTTVKEEDNR